MFRKVLFVEVVEGLSVDQEGELLSWMVEHFMLWLSGQMAIQLCGTGSAYVSLDEIGRFGINLDNIAVENKDVYKPDLSTSCLTLAIGYISNKWRLGHDACPDEDAQKPCLGLPANQQDEDQCGALGLLSDVRLLSPVQVLPPKFSSKSWGVYTRDMDISGFTLTVENFIVQQTTESIFQPLNTSTSSMKLVLYQLRSRTRSMRAFSSQQLQPRRAKQDLLSNLITMPLLTSTSILHKHG